MPEPTGPSPEATITFVGKRAAAGYVAGFLVATIGITVGGTLAGMDVGAAFGLGAFVGVWGGGGFGFMMGGTVPLARLLDAQAARARSAPDVRPPR